MSVKIIAKFISATEYNWDLDNDFKTLNILSRVKSVSCSVLPPNKRLYDIVTFTENVHSILPSTSAVPFPSTPLSVYRITAVLPWHLALSHIVQGHTVWKETKQRHTCIFFHSLKAIICSLKAELSQGLQKKWHFSNA